MNRRARIWTALLVAVALAAAVLITRWIMFLSVMSAIGLLVLRLIVARPAARVARPPGRAAGSSAGPIRALTRASIAATVIGLIAISVYLDVAIAEDSLRSVFDLGALVPLFRVTAFGRGYVDLEACFALFASAAGVALWVDRPDRPRRSVAELAAATGVLAAIAAVLLVPAAVGHAGQTSPRGLSVAFDAVHLLAGSVWIGALIGLLVLWGAAGRERRVALLALVVPRFSAVALTAVIVLLASGTGSTVVHMPAINALWDTSYGVAILVKIGLLALAVLLASGNLLRTRPRLAAARADPTGAAGAARLLHRLVGGEAVVVAGAVFTAAVLSSLAPPPPAFALAGSALAHVGPGRVTASVSRAGYRLQVLVAPNKARRRMTSPSGSRVAACRSAAPR